MRSAISLYIMILALSVFAFGQMTPVGEKVDKRTVSNNPLRLCRLLCRKDMPPERLREFFRMA